MTTPLDRLLLGVCATMARKYAKELNMDETLSDRPLYTLYARLTGLREMQARGCASEAEVAHTERLFCAALRAADTAFNMPVQPGAADAAAASPQN